MNMTARNMVLLVCAIMASLFMAELIVRIFVPQQLINLRKDVWKPVEVYGHRHHEHVNTLVNTGEKTVHFITDGNGYRLNRDSPQTGTRPDISILTLGDSFLAGMQVENEFTMSQVIGRQLERELGKPVHADNAGVVGWQPSHYYLEAKRILPIQSYDLGIVFLYTSNDIEEKRVASYVPTIAYPLHTFRIPTSLKWNEVVDAILFPFNDYWEERSHIFMLLKTAARVQLAKLGLTKLYFPPVFDVQEQESSRWKITAEICEDIQNEFHKYGIPVFFVLLPSSYQVHEDIFREYAEGFDVDPATVDLRQPGRLLKEVFLQKGVLLVDVLEHMRGKVKLGEQMYGTIDRHFNENGHRVVAEYILPTVESFLTDNESES